MQMCTGQMMCGNVSPTEKGIFLQETTPKPPARKNLFHLLFHSVGNFFRYLARISRDEAASFNSMRGAREGWNPANHGIFVRGLR